MIDERPFGGTCALRGCDPKKVLVHAAAVVDSAERLRAHGVLDATPTLQWSHLMRFKRTFTDPVPKQRVKSYEDEGIAVIKGHASFEDERTLSVDGQTLQAQNIVIATGATARSVASGDDLLMDSDRFLELDELPPSLVIVGGGFIAFEFAHVAARAGSRVTIVHDADRPLCEFDRSVVARLADLTRQLGIRIELNASVKSVRRVGGEIVVVAEQDGHMVTFSARAGLLAAGRSANLDALHVERGHIERTERGVKVDEFLQSVSNKYVYAAGDAADAGAAPLTPIAGYDAEIVAANLLAEHPRSADFRGFASMVYTIPPLGTVGLSEEEARSCGLDYVVNEGDMSDWYSTRYVAATSAYYKTLVERSTGRIVGATIFGPHATEQINVIALAIRNGLCVDALRDALFAYPTGSSDLAYMFGDQ